MPHDHVEFTFGCYRCELGLDEYRSALYEQIDEASVLGDDSNLTTYLRELRRLATIEDEWSERYYYMNNPQRKDPHGIN